MWYLICFSTLDIVFMFSQSFPSEIIIYCLCFFVIYKLLVIYTPNLLNEHNLSAVRSSCKWSVWFCLHCLSVLSLQELACRTIVSQTTIYGIDHLPLPPTLKSHLKSYALTNKTRARMLSFIHRDKHKKAKYLNPQDSPPMNCRKSCIIS